MEVLPDIAGPDPLVVLCGMAGCESGKLRDHYYETPGNAFWEFLRASGLTSVRLSPAEEERVVEHDLALTDLVQLPGRPPSYDLPALEAKLEKWQPEWLAFTSKTVAQAAARASAYEAAGSARPAGNRRRPGLFLLPRPAWADTADGGTRRRGARGGGTGRRGEAAVWPGGATFVHRPCPGGGPRGRPAPVAGPATRPDRTAPPALTCAFTTAPNDTPVEFPIRLRGLAVGAYGYHYI